MSEDEPTRGVTPVKVAIVALPLCLVISVIGAVWFHWHSGKQEEVDPGLALANQGMDPKEVGDLVEKFGWLNAEGWDTEAGRKGYRQRVALIAGTLSPQNYGYVVQRGRAQAHEGELWPVLWVDVAGGERKSEVIVVAVPYDLATGDVVSLLTAAKDLRDVAPERTIRLLFYPWSLQVSGEGVMEYAQGGERVAAILQLQQMDEEGVAADVRLRVVGPSLGSLESALQGAAVERVDRDVIEETVAVFGASGAAVHQTVVPVGVRDVFSKEEAPDRDAAALMERTRVLLGVVKRLAGSAGG